MAWQEFLKNGRGHNFHILFKRIFFSKTNLKLIEKQERFWGGGGFGGMLPRKIFENVHDLMAILVLFE